MWVHIWQREVSGAFLYVTMSSVQVPAGADPPKCINATRKHAEDDAFNPGKLSVVFNFSAPTPPSQHLSTYLLLHEFFPTSSNVNLLFHLQSLTLIFKLCKALTQTKVLSEMSIPAHALKSHICLFHTTSAVFLPLSLPLSELALLMFSTQSTAEPVLWWLHDCNACTLLPFLPLLTSTAFLQTQKEWLWHARSLSLPHYTCAYCHLGFEIWVLG